MDYTPIIIAVLSSSGLSSLVIYLLQRRDKKKENKSSSNRMLLGLGHDRILTLCEKFIERGSITIEEFDDLNKYLYEPYREMGGNGTVEKLMKKVEALKMTGDRV